MIGWLPEGNSILVCGHDRSRMPLRVQRLELASGRRSVVRELMPADPAGVTGIGQIFFTPEARCWAYSCFRTLSDLYLVRGLR